MVTQLGKILRIVRINTGDSMRDMAKKLDLSVSYLSAIENGKRNVPEDFEFKILNSYDLSSEDKESLSRAIKHITDEMNTELNDNRKKTFSADESNDSEALLEEDTDLIRFEGSNKSLFWRIHGDLINKDCKIVVPPTHQVIFIKDGKLQDILEPGTHKVFDVVKRGFLGIGKKLDSTVVDVIFVSKTVKLNCLWGTRNPIYKTDLFTNLPVSLKGNGEFEVSINNPKKFYLEIVGSDKHFTLESLKERLAGRMLLSIEDVISEVISSRSLTYLDISQHKKEISNAILPIINKMFINDCGLTLHSFTVSHLAIDDNEREAIEKQLKEERERLSNKADAREIANELQSYKDKKWKQDLILKNLEMADKAKYYEVLKLIGDKEDVSHGHRFCPDCGTEYKDGMKFCPNCGKRLSVGKIKCPNCGKEIDGGSKFCPFCGEKI